MANNRTSVSLTAEDMKIIRKLQASVRLTLGWVPNAGIIRIALRKMLEGSK